VLSHPSGWLLGMTNPDRRVAATATGQLGSFNRDQAHTAGLSDRQLRGRVQSGFLDQTGVRTFRSPTTPRSARSDLMTLLLDIGEPCWASALTAAALHGFDGFGVRRPFHVTVPRGRQVRRPGAIVHTTIVLPRIDRSSADGIPVTGAARTLIDLSRHVDAERLTAALDSGLRDGKFSEDHLHRRIVALRSSGRYGVPKLLDVIAGSEVTRGGHSWLEREYLRLIAAAGLPRPETQQVLTRAGDKLVRVDCRYPGTPVVVELLGYRFHRTTGQLRRDVDRVNALLLDGFAPFQFTYEQVVSEPEFVVATVSAALARFV
jgi:hypothetical protein